MRDRVWLGGALLSAILLAPAGAQLPQGATPIDSGIVVQLRQQSGEIVVGRLLSRFAPESDRLRLCPYPGRPWTERGDSARIREVARASVAEAWTHQGTELVKGAAIGALLGAVLGGIMQGLHSDTGYGGISGFIIGPGGGAIMGGMVGGAIPVWKRVASDSGS